MLARIALFLLFLQTPGAPSSSSGPDRPGDLDSRLGASVRSYQLEAVDFVDALTRVASDFQLPMGIEWVNTPSARAKVKLSWKKATVQKILQAVADGQPGYKIVVHKGVVHIFAANLIPDRENPLKLSISTFEVRNVTVEFASQELHDIVKRTVSPAGPQQRTGGVARSGASNIDDPKVSVRLSNTTVEDVLDALALASARKVWIVTFSDSPSLAASGYRRTLTLWNSFRIPDDEQPLWDLLHWG